MNVDIFHNTYHISNIAGGKKQEEIFESGKCSNRHFDLW